MSPEREHNRKTAMQYGVGNTSAIYCLNNMRDLGLMYLPGLTYLPAGSENNLNRAVENKITNFE